MTWANLHCHPSVKRAVMNSSKNGMLNQTTLIFGPPGAGQEDVARAITKTLICKEAEHDFCGTCASCINIDKGKRSYPDVIESHPAKSTYVIEQIRQLQSEAVLNPYAGDYKIFLLHECHRMNTESFNCLLKTLEEPYSHTVFILSTDTVSGILPTILSRCRKLRIPPQPIDELTRQLKQELPPFQAEALARFSGGLLGQARYWLNEEFIAVRGEVFAMMKSLLKNEAYTAMMVNGFQTTGGKKEAQRLHLKIRLQILLSLLRDAVSYSSGSAHPVYIHVDLADEYPKVWKDLPATHWIAAFEKTMDVMEGMTRYLNMNAQLTELFIFIKTPQLAYIN